MSISTFMTSILMVPWIKKFAFQFNILDKPDESHKRHSRPVPYLGGLAIVIPVCSALVIGLLFFDFGAESLIRIVTFILSCLTLSILGFLDDIKRLSVKTKLLIQILASFCVSLFMIINDFSVKLFENRYVNILISVIWVVVVTNAFNLVDNLDGSLSGISAITATTLVLISMTSGQYVITYFSAILFASSFGFLFWNKSPASIYLGDGGSLFLGFSFALVILQMDFEVASKWNSVLVPLCIVAVPLVDTFLVIVRRLRENRPIWVGSLDHMAHRLTFRGLSDQAAASILWCLSAAFAAIGFRVKDTNTISIELVIYALFFFCVVFLFLMMPHNNGEKKGSESSFS